MTAAATLTARPAAARIAAIVAAALVRMRNRGDYRRMLTLDEAHLRDMGLTRGAVRQALAG
jgi:uncharacterized protein YjiS (DUF1127 family)